MDWTDGRRHSIRERKPTENEDFEYDLYSEWLVELCYLSEADIEEEQTVAELDDASGAYQVSARNMIFGGFRAGVREDIIKKCSNRCAGCSGEVSEEEVSIDHIESTSHWFNRKGYLKDRLARMDWYNKTDNLQLMHKSCNSSKGGERYQLNKLKQMIEKGLL